MDDKTDAQRSKEAYGKKEVNTVLNTVLSLKTNLDYIADNFMTLAPQDKEKVLSLGSMLNVYFGNLKMPGELQQKMINMQKQTEISYALNKETFQRQYEVFADPSPKSFKALKKHFNKVRHLTTGGLQ